MKLRVNAVAVDVAAAVTGSVAVAAVTAEGAAVVNAGQFHAFLSLNFLVSRNLSLSPTVFHGLSTSFSLPLSFSLIIYLSLYPFFFSLSFSDSFSLLDR